MHLRLRLSVCPWSQQNFFLFGPISLLSCAHDSWWLLAHNSKSQLITACPWQLIAESVCRSVYFKTESLPVFPLLGPCLIIAVPNLTLLYKTVHSTVHTCALYCIQLYTLLYTYVNYVVHNYTFCTVVHNYTLCTVVHSYTLCTVVHNYTFSTVVHNYTLFS